MWTRTVGMSLLMVDVDHFKDVNDMLCRQGGDECVVLLSEADQGLYLAKREGRNRLRAAA